jgi:hypothetical protein
MRAHVRAIHGVGDLVGGIMYTVPNNPFTAKRGVGDLVGPVYYTVPNNPFTAKGMGHVGCGSDCGCGPCRSGNGMGQIDWSLTGDGIITSIEGALSQTGWPAIPNWVIYAAGVGIIFAVYQSDKRRRR